MLSTDKIFLANQICFEAETFKLILLGRPFAVV